MVIYGAVTRRRRRNGVMLALALALALVLVLAPCALASGQSGPGAAGPVLNAKALQRVLLAQDLPSLELLRVTADSHPFNGAAWQNKPIDLSTYGYVEREYLMSGQANVYGWVAGSDYSTRILRDGSYATRILVRRPANLHKWSGRVVVEMMNTSAGYDWTAVWSALWQSILARHDVYVGITSKAAVFPGMQVFDAERYAGLAMPNPLPPEEQAGGTMPGDADYDPNYSKLYENGLIWDIATQTGRLLKSRDRENPLRRPAKVVVLSGESQQGNALVSYYKWFTPAAYLRRGRPVFDGYLAECFVNANPQDPFPFFTQAPINQTEPLTNPLPADDPQLGWVPARVVPFAAVNSQWDYSAARGFESPKSYNTRKHKAVFWELAGSNHGWAWQYLYGDACAADLLKAGFWDPATYNWSTTPNNPEVPLFMAEKALYRDLLKWIKAPRKAPPVPRTIESVPNDPSIGYGEYRDAAVYDEYGNAKGGLRFPMIKVPVASYGEGRYILTPPDGSAEIVPFSDDVLKKLYRNRIAYVNKYRRAAMRLVQQRYLLPSDAHKLVRQAKKAVIPN